MGEIFANHISDRELISEIYKEFLHLIAEKQSFFFLVTPCSLQDLNSLTRDQIQVPAVSPNHWIAREFPGAKDLNRHFPKEEVQMANLYMKRCSTSQVKITMNYFTAVE